ncbi:uncharacterized protein LOC104907551 [Beta vulgaris subsp. vulgaris]|uniref:uncharacterized protein LOC104907551 n=1 Tax=Beta vulgaris subsp. vulgaris TaxID=3555 RepID=UPI002036E0C4|nr:uncharacterized protein LOC104907551 [Beta vulgaris subsp. vulgaris]
MLATWNRLRDIFQDNRNTRVVALEQEFSHLSIEDFSTASAYCQRLKELSDQLKNVASPVSNDRLVLQLVSGLTSSYSTVGTLIRQTSPLLPFYQARSMLTLEEVGFAKQAATSSTAAMVVASSPDLDESPVNSSHTYTHGGKKEQHRHNNNNKKTGGGGRHGGRGNGGGASGLGGRRGGS